MPAALLLISGNRWQPSISMCPISIPESLQISVTLYYRLLCRILWRIPEISTLFLLLYCLVFAWLLSSSHCIKSACIRSYSGPHFPAFGLNTERYSLSHRIQSECGKIRTRITLNKDTFSRNVCHTFFKQSVNLFLQLATKFFIRLHEFSEIFW